MHPVPEKNLTVDFFIFYFFIQKPSQLANFCILLYTTIQLYNKNTQHKHEKNNVEGCKHGSAKNHRNEVRMAVCRQDKDYTTIYMYMYI